MAIYDTIGRGYTSFRRPDPRIAAALSSALGDARSILNVGAGSGSYEPPGTVLAVEPSEVMIRQRPPGAARCLQASAESLPVPDKSVDAALAVLTMHHWPQPERGLAEMARTARRRVVILTWVPDGPPFWLTRDYFPEIMAFDRTVFPTTQALGGLLARAVGPTTITPVPVPHDCIDGFLGAYWRRPELYLEPDRRAAISSFARIDAGPGLARLRDDLSSGRWNDRQRDLLGAETLDVGYRLVHSTLP